MTRPAKAFANHTVPDRSESSARVIAGSANAVEPAQPPYERVRNGGMPPMMFQVRLSDGQTISFAYSDVREIRSRDAGHIQIAVFAMSRILITIEGRHLRELSNLLGMAMIRWMVEADERATERPETAAEIVKIRVEVLEKE